MVATRGGWREELFIELHYLEVSEKGFIVQPTGTTAARMSSSFGMVSIQSVEEYFGSLSSTSRRLMEDVSSVRNNYDSVWSELDEKERESIINESIVPPEISLEYHKEDKSTSPITVFPRYKVSTGQKTLNVELEGENNETRTYSYLDEHSAPFHWKTGSQQELRFEAGRPLSVTSEEIAEKGLEKLASPPSKILRTPLVRYSKGNPSFAKPVGIPVVPLRDEETDSNRASSPESIKSSQGLLASTRKSPASRLSSDAGLLGPSPSSTLSSLGSNYSSSSPSGHHRIVKPTTAPPPPPQKRSTSAPPPPPKNGVADEEDDDKTIVNGITSPLEENFKNFSINLSTDSIEIPKTGFDFLDNW